MIPEIPTSISKHFESMLHRMGNQLPMLWRENKTNFLLSYSGGKDSSILVLFLHYIKQKYNIETPRLFYLSHGIREITKQESEMESYVKSFGFPLHFVKKKSQNFLSN
ncbi:PP-loop domain protein [Leptospira yanagawae serovar Saopaulo str. Sao Paulo = ATCC 700523]|uniref:Arginosuccinate synthase n=2 Tax=Leptospira yanagawae TaxID=293069 RepID=A0ABY2M5S7_9LEPT|nr:ATP-binding protein [Leptospira yanagawae]EOQ89480.1 PP-loop domain protein [Leptospira yanagawae serovar Saopaulo str. Sao Paulo = ATCC 700523]TGL24565.1 arginosuccinate synthase [Leptospira yanagawae]